MTSDSGGKGLAVGAIKQFHKRCILYSCVIKLHWSMKLLLLLLQMFFYFPFSVIMIGDGMTDYEASPPAVRLLIIIIQLYC